MFRDRADRDIVDPGRGYLADVVEVDAAGSLEAERLAARAIARHGLAELGQREVVEQCEVGAGGEGLLELGQRLDLDLDRHPGTERARGRHGRADRTGGRDVVLFDEDAVEQADAVVAPAAAAHGVLLREPQPRNGLARVEERAACAGELLDVAARRGRRGGQRLQEVESGALAGEQRARRAVGLEQQRAGRQPLAVDGVPAQAELWVELAEHRIRERGAAQHRRLARDDARAAACASRHELRREVAAAEVLGQGARDGGLDVGGQGGIGAQGARLRTAGRGSAHPCTSASAPTARN